MKRECSEGSKHADENKKKGRRKKDLKFTKRKRTTKKGGKLKVC